MIGILFAEKAETNKILKTLNTKFTEFNGFKFYLGKYENKNVVICFSGIGKANAAAATISMIINFDVKLIINVGVAGSAHEGIEVGTIIFGKKIQYFDVDATSFGFKLNLMPYEPQHFLCNEHLVKKWTELFGEKNIIGTIATGDSVIDAKNIDRYSFLITSDILAIDMEACAIAQICNKSKTDFMIVKIVSDNVHISEKAKAQYKKSLDTLNSKIDEIALFIIKNF